MKQEALTTIFHFEKIRTDYKEVYFKNNLSDQTFEGQFINHVDKTIIFLNLNLQNFANNLLDKSIFDKILPTNSINDYNAVLQTYYTQTKSSFIYNFVSVVENYLRNVHKLILPNINTNHETFSKILKTIFVHFEIHGNDERKALKVLLKIRNNGYYNSKVKRLNIKITK